MRQKYSPKRIGQKDKQKFTLNDKTSSSSHKHYIAHYQFYAEQTSKTSAATIYRISSRGTAPTRPSELLPNTHDGHVVALITDDRGCFQQELRLLVLFSELQGAITDTSCQPVPGHRWVNQQHEGNHFAHATYAVSANLVRQQQLQKTQTESVRMHTPLTGITGTLKSTRIHIVNHAIRLVRTKEWFNKTNDCMARVASYYYTTQTRVKD